MFIQEQIRNTGCDNCSACDGAVNVCQIARVKPFKNMLMVVTDSPSKIDGQDDTVMKGYKDDLFWKVAKLCGVTSDNIYPTYSVKCRPSDGHKPEGKEIAACSTYLEEEILLLKPKCILVLGATAMKSFGFKGAFNKLRGSVNDMTFGEGPDKFKTKIIVTYAPFFVENAPNSRQTFSKDIVRAYNIAMGIQSTAQLSNVVLADTLEKVEEAISYCEQTKECCFDYETTTLEELSTYDPNFRVTLLSLSFQHGSAYAIPLWHDESPFNEKEKRWILKQVSERLFQNPKIRKIAHNIKFDMLVSIFLGIGIFRGRLDDTMLMHHILWENERHGLKEFMPKLYPAYDGYDDEIKQYGYSNAPMSVLAPYGGTDTDLTFRACTIFENLLLKDKKLYRVYRSQVMFALKSFVDAEDHGMFISREMLTKNIKRATYLLKQQEKKIINTYPQIDKFKQAERERLKLIQIAKLEKEIEEKKTEKAVEFRRKKIKELQRGTIVPDYNFEVSSPAKVGRLLYTKEGFGFPKPYDKKKRGESMSTDAKFLKLIKDPTGIIKDIMVYRTIAINLNTFMIGFLDLLDKNDYIHTSFLPHGTVTGRLSSKNPNLQNVSTHIKIDDPAVEETVESVKKGFVAPPGYAIVQGDFSQAELRAVADFAFEENMIKAFNENVDIHVLTAAIIAGYSLEDFNKLLEKERKALRQKAKAANFGLIYGQQAEGFMDYAKDKYGVDMSLIEAARIRKAFFDAYPKLLDYHEECIDKAHTFGHVRTLFGRCRHLLDIHGDDDYKVLKEEREAINSRIQGTVGEMAIFAIALLKYRLPKSVKFVNTVHDSIVYYVPYRLVPYVTKVLKHTAENLPTKQFFGKELKHLKLVMDIDVSVTTWKDLKKYTPENWAEMLKTIK